MAVHYVSAERGGLIKESLWVKLKAFPTNVGRPNNVRKISSSSYIWPKLIHAACSRTVARSLCDS